MEEEGPVIVNYPAYEPALHGNTGNGSRLQWGELHGYEIIHKTLKDAYDEIMKWRKNFFKIPYGAPGKALVVELTKLLTLYNNKSDWERLLFELNQG